MDRIACIRAHGGIVKPLGGRITRSPKLRHDDSSAVMRPLVTEYCGAAPGPLK